MAGNDIPQTNDPPHNSPREGRIARKYLTALQSMSYRGPFPPAEEIERWEKLLPNAADRFVTLLEEQTKAEIALDQKQSEMYTAIVRQDFITKTLGQVFALVIAIVAIVAGTYVTLQGHPLPGALIGSSGVLFLAGVFIYDRLFPQVRKSAPEIITPQQASEKKPN